MHHLAQLHAHHREQVVGLLSIGEQPVQGAQGEPAILAGDAGRQLPDGLLGERAADLLHRLTRDPHRLPLAGASIEEDAELLDLPGQPAQVRADELDQDVDVEVVEVALLVLSKTSLQKKVELMM